MLIRRFALLLAALVTSLAAALVAATPAQADFNQCRDEGGDLCFWSSGGYQGAFGRLAGTNARWTVFSQGQCPSDTWNDCASSLRNEGRNCEAVVYSASYFGGDSWVINRDTAAAWLSSWGRPSGGNWDNVISSNSWWCG